MSRSDHYVGLNKLAKNFIEKFPINEIIKKQKIKICKLYFDNCYAYGYQIKTKDRIYKEELQLTLWSSGPIYLTHVAIYNLNNKLIGYIGSWKEDEKLLEKHIELDFKEGTYYI